MKTNLPCPCGKSKRGYAIYDDGHGYCFYGDCESPFFSSDEQKENLMEQKEEIKLTTTLNLKQNFVLDIKEKIRGIAPEILDKYQIKITRNPFIISSNKALQGDFLTYQYTNQKGELIAEEYQKIDDNKFRAFNGSKTGADSALFGYLAFPYKALKTAKYVTLVEGKLDAPSAHQMLGNQSVVYSVGSAGEVKKDLANSYEYLCGFERIYLCFDNDEAGRAATKAAKEILPPHKIYVFPHDEEDKNLKDANDYLVQGKQEEFVRRWWRASIPKVDGIVVTPEDYKIWLNEKPEQKFAYPFPTLQEKLCGVRSNELTLITADTGVGKSSFMREIEYEALMKTKDSLGLLHFEDSHQMKLFGLMNLYAGKRMHLPTSTHSKEEEEKAFSSTFGTGRLISLDNFGIYQPKLLLDRIEYLIKVYNCKFIFLDHITIAVAGIEDERVALDDLSTKLRAVCNSYDVAMFIISHVNDNGRTRSSRALEQLCDNHLHLYRDLLNEDPKAINETKVMIKKNRFGSITGYGGKLLWDSFSGKMKEI